MKMTSKAPSEAIYQTKMASAHVEGTTTCKKHEVESRWFRWS